MSRLADLFADARAEGRTAFLPFMTAGLPDPQSSVAVISAMMEAGADGCEIGIPYSDPLMDGPVVQAASDRAIAAGTTIERALEIARQVIERTSTVALAMTYANPVFRRGVDWFVAELERAGVSGVIVPDLPVEESTSLIHACRRHGLDTIQFVAPTSDRHRIERVAAAEPGFIYAIAELGVTGEREAASSHAARLVEDIRAVTDTPIVFGVGIATPDQARAAAGAGADGVIVGSALVRAVLEAEDPNLAPALVGDMVGRFVTALRSDAGASV